MWGPVQEHEDCRLSLTTPYDDRNGYTATWERTTRLRDVRRVITAKIPASPSGLVLAESVLPGGAVIAATATPLLEHMFGRGTGTTRERRQCFRPQRRGAGRDLDALPAYVDERTERLALATDATRAALDTLDRKS